MLPTDASEKQGNFGGVQRFLLQKASSRNTFSAMLWPNKWPEWIYTIETSVSYSTGVMPWSLNKFRYVT